MADMERESSEDLVANFSKFLVEAGYAKATRSKYRTDLQQFMNFLLGKPASDEACLKYRDYLQRNYKVSSTNSKIAAINAFFRFAGWDQQITPLEPERRVLPPLGEELTVAEYRQLLKEAKRENNMRLYYLMQVLSSTKISISEHKYVTVEAVDQGYMIIPRGKKSRAVFIPDKLRKDLLLYCKKAKIRSGSVFVNWNGTPLDRSNVHKYLKRLCPGAGVDPKKVTPRNLTHVVEFSSAVYMLGSRNVDLAQ